MDDGGGKAGERGYTKSVGLATLLRPRTAALRSPGPSGSKSVKAGGG